MELEASSSYSTSAFSFEPIQYDVEDPANQSEVVERGIKRHASGDAEEFCSAAARDGFLEVLSDCVGFSSSEVEANPVNSASDETRLGERSESMAATKLQKSYRSYRTRRRLADSAIVAEELWWQAIDYVRLNHSTVSFFNHPETAISRWSRIGLNASKVGKGLSKDEKAQKLAFQHWIEAIDTRHRYGHNLHFYYDEWCKSQAGQPFFYWLDLGEGKNLDLEKCPRSLLRQQCIKYLGPMEREHYEYVLVMGKIFHKQSGVLLDTNESEGAKWIFVMSTVRKLYVGQKKKGNFHHSSFLAGGATLAAGRLSAEKGVLKRISSYSGHYRPTEESRENFLSFLRESGVDLTLVQIASFKDDEEDVPRPIKAKNLAVSALSVPPPKLVIPRFSMKIATNGEVHGSKAAVDVAASPLARHERALSGGLRSPKTEVREEAIKERIRLKKGSSSYQLGHQISGKWCTGAGPRIGCVADYPLELRIQALELVDLSPKTMTPSPSSMSPIFPRLSSLSFI